MKHKNILILPKHAFDHFTKNNSINDSTVENFKNTAFISIHNTKDDYKYAFSKNHSNVINLTFDDVEEDMPEKHVYAMTMKQANEIIDFIIKNSDKHFILHCTAGISRSGAIGTFIANYFNVDVVKFNLDNPHIIANSHVLKLLNGIMWEKHFNTI